MIVKPGQACQWKPVASFARAMARKSEGEINMSYKQWELVYEDDLFAAPGSAWKKSNARAAHAQPYIAPTLGRPET